jgi:hypothetical protein
MDAFAYNHQWERLERLLTEGLSALRKGSSGFTWLALKHAFLVRSEVLQTIQTTGHEICRVDQGLHQKLLRALGLSTYYTVRAHLGISSTGPGPIYGAAFGVRTTWLMLLTALVMPPPTPQRPSWALSPEPAPVSLWKRTIAMYLSLYQLLQPRVYHHDIVATVIILLSYMTSPPRIRQLPRAAQVEWRRKKTASIGRLVDLVVSRDAKPPGDRPSSAQFLFSIMYAHFGLKLQAEYGPEAKDWVM